ncbi:MAG: polysaccharide biosynthesis tyrosine autokinase [Planctomycetes bacterium]|nr:polysaccharide biosynthesis tyrosine autokinase [Planctomycetota bacterium]
MNEQNDPRTTLSTADHTATHGSPDGAADAVQAVLRFLRVLRYRKTYVITSLVVASLLGCLYYFTATKIYKASAQLLITQSGPDVWKTSMSTGAQQDSLILTYERLFASAVVLDGAVQRLAMLAPESRIDLNTLPREKWADVLRSNLSASVVRRTNIIELGYRSQSPIAAESVVEAIVDSYLEFMEKNHRDVSVEIVSILQKERKEKENELHLLQKRLLELKKLAGDLGLREGSTVVHPIVQRVVKLNDTLVDVQKERLQLEASRAAIQAAMRTGGDLRQHLLTVDPIVGRELIMNAMGLSPQAIGLVNSMERKLLDDRAKLATLREHYGPTHPEIQELFRAISNAERHIATYQETLNARMNQVEGQQLGSTLLGMVEQKLNETLGHEKQLIEEYKAAETVAIQMNDRLAELQIVENHVRRTSKQHDVLLDRIADIDLNTEGGNVRVAIVSDASSSGVPVSPRLSMVGILCLMSGGGIGIALAYVLDLLDDRFRSPDELKEQIGIPVLAMIRQLTEFDDAGADSLQVHVASSAVESEAFRTLRTTLAFSGQELQRVAITSSEPSDGKTTVLANLGTSYAQAGKRTLLIDCDLRRPGLTKLFQLRGTTGVSNVLRSEDDVAALASEYTQQTGVDGLEILASGPKPSNPVELLSGDRFMDLIAWAEVNYDQVLVDCPPVMAASDAAIVGRLVDGMMLVVQPDKNHRRLVLRAAEYLLSMQVNLIGSVANRVGEDIGGYGYGYGYGYGEGYGIDDPDDDQIGEDSFEPTTDPIEPRRAA